ncbi:MULTISPECIES: hypothetical protein [unclassified Streptomyces]|uniref:hypothetical protein n=1 Tax=unclassified Streptomyces TaxID=2593676 RepID=UPI002E1A5A74|nr:hypothetical protein OG217_19625 [Streptomyces sp. NBC_01023]
MPNRHQPDSFPAGTNFGIVNSGHMSGAQAAPFSQNASQTNNISPAATDAARESIEALRQDLEALRGRHPDADGALRDLDEITPRIDEPDRDPSALRYMLRNLVERCGGIPGILAAAQLVQSTVTALLPAS